MMCGKATKGYFFGMQSGTRANQVIRVLYYMMNKVLRHYNISFGHWELLLSLKFLFSVSEPATSVMKPETCKALTEGCKNTSRLK